MTRQAARPAKLTPVLLGIALLVPVSWYFVRADGGDPPPVAQAAARRDRSSRPGEDAALSQRSNASDATTDRPPEELSMPVAGVDPGMLRPGFSEGRSGHRSHEALDILAPRGTAVLAAGDGVVKKLFTSVRGGLTVYQFDRQERYCYYYAHLDSYVPGLREGQTVRTGDLIGTVGSTGNAREDAPHLHFAVTRLDPDGKWWGGTPIDPYPLLVKKP